MVREIGVHYYYVGSGSVFEAVDVGGAETEFAGAGFENDAGGGVEGLELLGYGEGAVGGAVVDDYYFPV